MNSKEVEEILISELAKFRDEGLRRLAKSFVVLPSPKSLIFEWINPVENYESWIVCDMKERNVVVVYASGGFASKGSPWGLVYGNKSYSGPPSCWYRTLEDCIADYGC